MKRIAPWALLAVLAMASLAAAASTFITLSSETGDPIGASLAGAAPQPFTPTTGSINASSNSRNGISVTFSPNPAGENLHLDFGPRVGFSFDPARYEIPQRFPVASPDRPALEIYRDGHRCTTIQGRFIVLEYVHDNNGALVSLAIDFEQYCDGNTAALTGGVRINSSTPYAPEVLARTATGDSDSGPVTLGIASPDRPCALLDAEFDRARDLGPVPFPYGIIAFRAVGCDPVAPAVFTVTLLEPPGDNLILWKFGPTPDNHGAHWYTIPISVTGSTISFGITDATKGDDDITTDNLPDGLIYNYGGFTTGPTMQDMWWGGTSENGWGVSIVEHGGALFCVLYIYDASGNPTWYVMPEGQWSGPFGAYTGSVYHPHGSAYYAYDSGVFNAGLAVGTMTVSFSDVNNATLDYTIDGKSGHKTIMRQLFGPSSTMVPDPGLGDMWWGGPALNGYGLAVIEQNASLFTVWFSYDANGSPTWFVMPAGSWTDDTLTTYAGHIYQTMGSPWLGATYDASKLRVNDVGTFRLHFDSPTSPFDYSIQTHTGTLSLVRQPF